MCPAVRETPPDNAIEVRSLSKRYGAVDAVNDLSFSLAKGEVLGFLGPNGAGKSTSMKMIAGFVPVSSGEIRVFGHDIQQEPILARRKIGYLPEGSPLYGEMTVKAFLDFIAAVRGLHGTERRRRMDEVIAALELDIILYQHIDTLSKGFKRRVGFAQAVLHDPEVLILDEPTDGLDPNQKFQVRNLIRSMGRNKAIIISTHLLEEVDAVCDRAIIINRGRLVFNGTPAALRAVAPDHNAVLVRLAPGDINRAMAVAKAAEPGSTVTTRKSADGGATLVIHAPGRAPVVGAISLALREAGITPLEIGIETGDLDAVFRTLTTSPQAGSGAMS